MEKKLPKKSINTMIYLLLAAMLICMVFVSVYTIASKRERGSRTEGQPEVEDQSETKNGSDARINYESKDTADLESSDDGRSENNKKKNEGTENNVNVGADSDAAEVGVLPANEADEDPLSTAEHYFVIPVSGFISKDFEIDIPVWSATMNDYRAHTGTDIAAAVGSEVIAASSGRVCKIWNDPMMGKSVTIDHGDDIYTTYMNLGDEVTVSVGEKVGMGQVIGCIGTSSLIEVAEEPHLHFEFKLGGEYADPLDYISTEYSADNE